MLRFLVKQIVLIQEVAHYLRQGKIFNEPHMRKMIEEEAITESYRACRIVPPGLSENIGDMAALALAKESIVIVYQ